MVSGSEISIFQNGNELIISPRYLEDPQFTLDQEKALYEIAKSFLMVNRQKERRRRYAEKRKNKAEEET